MLCGLCICNAAVSAMRGIIGCDAEARHMFSKSELWSWMVARNTIFLRAFCSRLDKRGVHNSAVGALAIPDSFCARDSRPKHSSLSSLLLDDPVDEVAFRMHIGANLYENRCMSCNFEGFCYLFQILAASLRKIA